MPRGRILPVTTARYRSAPAGVLGETVQLGPLVAGAWARPTCGSSRRPCTSTRALRAGPSSSTTTRRRRSRCRSRTGQRGRGSPVSVGAGESRLFCYASAMRSHIVITIVFTGLALACGPSGGGETDSRTTTDSSSGTDSGTNSTTTATTTAGSSDGTDSGATTDTGGDTDGVCPALPEIPDEMAEADYPGFAAMLLCGAAEACGCPNHDGDCEASVEMTTAADMAMAQQLGLTWNDACPRHILVFKVGRGCGNGFDCQDPDSVESCNLYYGTTPDGEACSPLPVAFVTECLAGSTCDEGVCVPIEDSIQVVGEGEICREGPIIIAQCDLNEDLICDIATDLCVPGTPLGETCKNSLECLDGWCDEDSDPQVCIPQKANGEACTSASECEGNCVENICTGFICAVFQL